MKPANLNKQELENLLALLLSKDRSMVELGLTLLEKIKWNETLVLKMNVGKLLLHQHGKLVQLVLNWVETFNLGTEFLTELFVLYKCTGKRKIRKKAQVLLEKDASPELKEKLKHKWLLRRANSRATIPTDATIKRNIIRYTEGCEINGGRVAHLLYQKYGVGGNYLLTVPVKEERRKFLKKHIVGTSLRIRGKKLDAFPEELFEFSELTEIDLSNNAIPSIPDAIQELKNLKILRLNHNKLMYISPNIAKLKNLESLQISHNVFKEYPEILFQLEGLRKLEMVELSKFRSGWHSYYSFTALPPNFKNWNQLEELHIRSKEDRPHPYVNYPQITSVKAPKGERLNLNPLSLAQMAYDQNKEGIAYIFKKGTAEMIQAVLQDFYDKKTASLDLSGIVLDQLPETILELNIKHLNLSNCHLGRNKVDISCLSGLKDLESLNLEDNFLNQLPEALNELKNLKILYLSQNQFSSFPRVIYKYKNLVSLHFKNALQWNCTSIQILKNLSDLTELRAMEFYFPSMNREIYKTLLEELIPNCQIDFSR